MNRMKNVLGAVLLLVPFAAGATTTSYVFDSVTKIQYGVEQSVNVFLTGTLSGDSTPTTVSAPDSMPSCHDLYNQMQQVPGKYLLTLTIDVRSDPGLPTSTNLRSCSLELKP
jgi:hypothetical protein